MAGYANPDPSVTTLSLPVRTSAGTTIGTATFTVSLWETTAVATLAATQLNLPAGRWQLVSTVGAKPESVAPPVQSTVLDTGVVAAGTQSAPAQTVRSYRAMDGSTGSVFCSVDVRLWDGAHWQDYACSWTSEAACSVAVPAAAAPNSSALPLWGVQAHVYIPASRPAESLTACLQQFQAAAGTLVRTSIPWALLEPNSSVVDPTAQAQADAFFQACATLGLKTCVIVDSHAPAWAATGGVLGKPPASWTDYTNFVSYVLGRWSGSIIAVEPYNEPDAGTAYAPADVVAATAQLSAAVRAAGLSGQISVLGGVLSGCDDTYLSTLYANGFAGTCDAVSVHPYHVRFDQGGSQGVTGKITQPDVPWEESLSGENRTCLVQGTARIHEVMRVNGEGAKPIWVTETGYSTSFTGTGGTQSSLDTSEAQQAAYLRTTLRQAARIPYVSALIWNMLYDNPSSSNDWSLNAWDDNFGLLDAWGVRQKPAYGQFKQTIADIAAGAA